MMTASNGHNLALTAKKELTQAAPNTRLKAHRLKKHWSQVYVATMIGTNDVSVSRWESGATFPSLYYRQQLCELFGKSAEELGLIPAIAEIGQQEAPPAPAPARSSALWRVPSRRNPFFTGREAVLDRLHHLLHADKAATSPVLALSGLGGVGKTQTALEYAYRARDDYAAVLWVKADTQENLLSDLAALARALDLPEHSQQDQGRVVQAVTRWLSEQSNWLLILDNVEDLLLLNEIIPAECQGHVLVTTRAQVTGTVARRVDLVEMEVEEGILFLLRRTNCLRPGAALSEAPAVEYQRARKIVELVDGLPLALDQAGAYIEETGCGLGGYLERYQAQQAAMLNRRGSLAVDHPDSIGATLSLSFGQVQQLNPAAADLLRLCAFLDPDTIPQELFLAAGDALAPALQAVAASPYALDDALAALRRYSLIRRDPTTRTLLVHRLVQVMLRESMDEQTQRQWAERAVRAISRAFPDVHEPASWLACQRCWPQALAGVALIQQWEMRSPEAGHLLKHAGAYLQRVRVDYAQAERLFKKAFVMYRRVLGPDHLDLASCLNKLAVLYRFEKNYARAERLHRRALAIRERALGSVHPDVATSLNNLAVLYMDQHRDEEAEQLCLRGLAIREQVWGPEHPEVAISLHNLATLYEDQGKHEQAEALHLRALAIREKMLGPDHPDVGTTLNHLANLYRDQGKSAQAEEFYHGALAIQSRALGPEHPSTLHTRADYAQLLAKLECERQPAPARQQEVLLLSDYLHSRASR
jgi:tetratricopeptide (TPR) repeat protein